MKLVDNYLDSIQEILPVPVMVAFSAASLSMAAFNLYKQHLTKAARMCRDLPPKEKSVCMLNYKIQGKKLQLAKLKDGLGECAKIKKAAECKENLTKKAKKVDDQIKFLSNRMREVRKQRYQ